jgi:hypothetical protein
MFKPLKVLDIELRHPLEDIRGLDRYEAVQGLVRLCSRPTGYLKMSLAPATVSVPGRLNSR